MGKIEIDVSDNVVFVVLILGIFAVMGLVLVST